MSNAAESLREGVPLRERVSEFPATFAGKLRLFLVHLHGVIIFFFLRLKYRSFIRVAKPMTRHLEAEIFPLLREERLDTFTLKVKQETDGSYSIEGESTGRRQKFPGTEAMAKILWRKGLERIHLSTFLESNQILEALLVFLYVQSRISGAVPAATCPVTWNRNALASALLGENGFHKFCADMRYDADTHEYGIEYTYCELFMSRAARGYAEKKSDRGDHRAFFAAAPRAALLVLVLLLLPVALLWVHMYVGMFLWLIVCVVLPVWIWCTVHTLGSMQYDREHRDLLVFEYIRTVNALARFPETNPNPVIKLGRDGKLLYANPSAFDLLKKMNVASGKIEELLPTDYRALAERCLASSGPSESEETRHGIVLRYRMSPFPDDRSVIVAGNDVTILREAENELRDLNQNLEKSIAKRTDELRETQDVTILCLAGLAEVRDPETGALAAHTPVCKGPRRTAQSSSAL
ncbi:hypothetical protein ACFL1X_05035 [Candidatus Hydrogenedentota bacterium]